LIQPVRGRRTFAAVRSKGIRVRHGVLSASFLPGTGTDGLAVAYAITKRVGGAVQRNRLRRRLRAVIAELAGDPTIDTPDGVLVIAAGPEARDRGPKELRNDVERLFEAIATRVGASR
jgi:ribonuclease P protein component